jgi:hypothetical protein
VVVADVAARCQQFQTIGSHSEPMVPHLPGFQPDRVGFAAKPGMPLSAAVFTVVPLVSNRE